MIHKTYNEIEVKLYTDKEGKITLGHLKNCMVINASAKVGNVNFSREWKLVDKSDAHIFPQHLDVLESENPDFPFPFEKLGRTKVSLA